MYCYQTNGWKIVKCLVCVDEKVGEMSDHFLVEDRLIERLKYYVDREVPGE